MKLKIELVPMTAWYNNLRSQFTTEQWDFIRKAAYRRANYCCEICGGKGSTHPVEAHEEWDYDDTKFTMKLRKVIVLCPACHQVKHIGLAQINGKYDEAFRHFAKVNQFSRYEANDEVEKAFSLYQKRSEHYWHLDIQSMKDYIETKVPTPSSVQEQIQIGNALQIQIQKDVEVFAEVNQLSNADKKMLNEAFNRLIHGYAMLKSLEYNAYVRVDHLKKLSTVTQIMLMGISETNDWIMANFKELVSKPVAPNGYAEFVPLLVKIITGEAK